MNQAGDTTPYNPTVLERYKYLIFSAITVALATGIAVLIWQRPKPTTITVLPPAPTPIPSATPVPTATATPGPYMVYVTGAVVDPEALVTLSFGSRVLDAVNAAGGPLANADLERVNLAQRLEDGDQIHVPTRAAGDPTMSARSAQSMTATPGSLTVYVVGEVRRAGTLIALPVGSRVEDVIDAAGGTTDNADLTRVNLSQIVYDGDYIYVPPLSGTPIATPTPNRPPVIRINSATLDELDSLPGIGPALAQTIIDYRTENGPFTSLEDLDNVPGIGPSKLEAIRDMIVFD